MSGQFIVFERGQNGPLESRAAGLILPAGANILYVAGCDRAGHETEAWLASPEWPYREGEATLGQFVVEVKPLYD
jgi:hypothetical protein